MFLFFTLTHNLLCYSTYYLYLLLTHTLYFFLIYVQGVRGKRSTNTFTSEEAKELLKNVNNIPSNGDVIVTSSPDIMSSQLTDDNDNVGGNSGGGDGGGMSFNGGDQHYFE